MRAVSWPIVSGKPPSSCVGRVVPEGRGVLVHSKVGFDKRVCMLFLQVRHYMMSVANPACTLAVAAVAAVMVLASPTLFLISLIRISVPSMLTVTPWYSAISVPPSSQPSTFSQLDGPNVCFYSVCRDRRCAAVKTTHVCLDVNTHVACVLLVRLRRQIGLAVRSCVTVLHM